MKQFFLGYLLSALIIPTLSIAQTAQLTEQLGKTVLYGDIALSPDGSRLAWVQSTAATTSKQTYIQATSGNSSAANLNQGSLNPRRIIAEGVTEADSPSTQPLRRSRLTSTAPMEFPNEAFQERSEPWPAGGRALFLFARHSGAKAYGHFGGRSTQKKGASGQ